MTTPLAQRPEELSHEQVAVTLSGVDQLGESQGEALSVSLSFPRGVTPESLSSVRMGLKQGVSDILGWVILCCGDCPEHYRMLRTMPGLHPQDAGSIPSLSSALTVTIKTPPDIARCPWVAIIPGGRDAQ